ncbi:MAG: DNA repair protein RecO [candidate division Zixibacteria bacterium]|nr:DNA repair protein RecO [candidate division Zixibacteria bacterium]
MPLEKTEAIVLKSFNWSESSRTVVFFSRDRGKIALVDKGGRRFKSKRGRLTPFALLELTFYSSEKESRGYISDIHLVETFSFESDGTVGRLAFGSAACELLQVLLPEEEPQENLFNYFASYLRNIETFHKRSLPGLFLAFFLRLLSQLGYHPSLAYCASCGRDVDSVRSHLETDEDEKATSLSFSVDFFPERGGLLCPACQTTADYYIPLSVDDMKYLLELQNASLKEAATVPIGYRNAMRLIEALTRFLGFQTGLKMNLKSLEFLDKLKNTRLSE